MRRIAIIGVDPRENELFLGLLEGAHSETHLDFVFA